MEEGQEIPLARRHFIDQCEFAREVIVMITEMMNELGSSRANSRQSAASEQLDNQSVDLDAETNNNARGSGTQVPYQPMAQTKG